MTPLEFLRQLWQYKPDDQYILIWTLPDKRSRWFTGVPEAAEYVASIGRSRDVYVGVGLSGKDYGPTRRCVSGEVTAIGGLASDFDLLSEAHKGKPLPQTVEQALSILPPMMQPTIIILTGNGLQAWWLLKEPYVFENDEDRRKVAGIMARWHTMLGLRSAANGWVYERLSDLARILRVPGTKNRKDPANPKDVTVHSARDRYYNLSDFAEFLDAAGIPDPDAEERAAREWRERFADKPIKVNPAARIPQDLLNAWMDPASVDPVTAMKFANTWQRQRHDLKDQTQSGYDLALANFGVDAGLSEQQIVDLIVQHRAMHRHTVKPEADYYRRTIAKALDKRGADVTSSPAGMSGSAPPTAAAAALGESPIPSVAIPLPGADGAGANGAVPIVEQATQSPDMAKAILCQRISQLLGIEVLCLVKFEGKDPTYHMHTARGIVEFESVDNFVAYASVRSKIAAKAGILIRRFKPAEWDTLAQMMLNACVIEECTEEEEFEGGARAHVLDYLAETDFIPAIEGQRIQDQRKPMVLDGRIALCSSDFASYLDKTKNLKLSIKAAASMLGALGAKKTQRMRSSRFGSQSRWALPVPEFDPHEIKPGMAEITQLDPTDPQEGRRSNEPGADLCGPHSETNEQINAAPRPNPGNCGGGGRRDAGIPYLRPPVAGTGKTTTLTRQIQRAVDRFGTDSVLVTSFSRTAAAELAGRDLPISPDRVGTLHSHCWHGLGGPEIAEANVDEWNRDNPALAITPVKKQGKLDGQEAAGDDSESEKRGDELLQQLNRYRGLMLPHDGWNESLAAFERLWTEYKRENGLLDFTDLIETCLRGVALAPKNPSVIFADEAQDLNRMQLSLVRKWGERANYFIICGDDDQASLPGSMIVTEAGRLVPVETLNPEQHRLASYDLVHSQLIGLHTGYRFNIQASPYSGQAVRVKSGGRATETTHNHPWLFRWSESSRDKHVVYLMRKGESFRVGWCKLIRADGSCHLGVRAYLEGADAAWILRLCSSRSEASLWESYIAAEYGICTVVWRPMHNQCGGHYTAEVISRLFGMLGNQLDRGARCLQAFGRDVNLPFYERGKCNRSGALTNKTAACNLIPEIMAVPVAESFSAAGVKWRPIDAIERFHYDGCVYGLNVPPHHTYVADGIVTHNCIYGFTGATPDAFLDPDIPNDHKIVLKQSYRVPRAVHRLAESLIHQVTRRQEKEYLPRPEDGALDRFSRDGYLRTEYAILKTATEHIEQGKTVMFLASCAYMLRSLTAVLRKQGIPFHNPYRKSNGFWNPLRIGKRASSAARVLSLLVGHPEYGEDHRPWTNGDVALWAEALQANGILRHGVKAKLKAADLAKPATMERLDEIFEPAALESLMAAWEGSYRDLLNWWSTRVNMDLRQRVQFPALVAAMRGPQALAQTPQAIVGTIHCSPPDEQILTKRGWVPICELNQADRLVGYSRGCNRVIGGSVHVNSDGYQFERCERPYRGKLIIFETEESRTRVTPNHRVLASFDPDTFFERWAVYLMRRKNWWRIGICTTAHRPYRSGGLNGRLATEQADAGWLLGIYETRREALIAEAALQAQYGIPGLTFRSGLGRTLSDHDLATIHEDAVHSVWRRAHTLLSDFALNAAWPLYARSRSRRNLRGLFLTEAANLLPLGGRVRMATTRGSLKPNLLRTTVSIEKYCGPVFGLDVPPYHHYVSGGAVVHNSVKGGQSDVVYLFPDLSQAGDAQYRRDGPPRDSVIRQFYVGATRAREKLYICGRESSMAISI